MWSYILMAVGVTGLYLAGRKNYWGWAIGLFAQLLWMAYAVVTHQYGFFVSAIVYGGVYANNLIKWRPDRKIKMDNKTITVQFTRNTDESAIMGHFKDLHGKTI
jgi:cytochrome c oxidase assembly protein Cox11